MREVGGLQCNLMYMRHVGLFPSVLVLGLACKNLSAFFCFSRIASHKPRGHPEHRVRDAVNPAGKRGQGVGKCACGKAAEGFVGLLVFLLAFFLVVFIGGALAPEHPASPPVVPSACVCLCVPACVCTCVPASAWVCLGVYGFAAAAIMAQAARHVWIGGLRSLRFQIQAAQAQVQLEPAPGNRFLPVPRAEKRFDPTPCRRLSPCLPAVGLPRPWPCGGLNQVTICAEEVGSVGLKRGCASRLQREWRRRRESRRLPRSLSIWTCKQPHLWYGPKAGNGAPLWPLYQDPSPSSLLFNLSARLSRIRACWMPCFRTWCMAMATHIPEPINMAGMRRMLWRRHARSAFGSPLGHLPACSLEHTVAHQHRCLLPAACSKWQA